MQYFNPDVYDADNLTAQFVTEESCFVTMMEVISAAMLTSTYFCTRRRQASTEETSSIDS